MLGKIWKSFFVYRLKGARLTHVLSTRTFTSYIAGANCFVILKGNVLRLFEQFMDFIMQLYV